MSICEAHCLSSTLRHSYSYHLLMNVFLIDYLPILSKGFIYVSLSVQVSDACSARLSGENAPPVLGTLGQVSRGVYDQHTNRSSFPDHSRPTEVAPGHQHILRQGHAGMNSTKRSPRTIQCPMAHIACVLLVTGIPMSTTAR